MLAIIPAKKNSSRLKNKNIKLFHNKPLIWHSIKEALKTKKISHLIVSTDSNQIAKLSKRFGADVPFLRPKNLCKKNSSLLDVCRHALNYLEIKKKKYSSAIVLQPTSPLRTSKDINNAIEIYKKNKADVLASFLEAKPLDWHRELKKNGTFKNFTLKKNSTYQAAKKNYLLNGAIYIFSADFLKSKKKKFKMISYIMPKERSVDIDNQTDFEYASYLYKNKKKFNL
jgi:CMP-N,N'-diacetyllegionaminic acid synthase